jgi:hypothetical protein
LIPVYDKRKTSRFSTTIFGYPAFRGHQAEVIDHVARGTTPHRRNGGQPATRVAATWMVNEDIDPVPQGRWVCDPYAMSNTVEKKLCRADSDVRTTHAAQVRARPQPAIASCNLRGVGCFTKHQPVMSSVASGQALRGDLC